MALQAERRAKPRRAELWRQRRAEGASCEEVAQGEAKPYRRIIVLSRTQLLFGHGGAKMKSDGWSCETSNQSDDSKEQPRKRARGGESQRERATKRRDLGGGSGRSGGGVESGDFRSTAARFPGASRRSPSAFVLSIVRAFVRLHQILENNARFRWCVDVLCACVCTTLSMTSPLRVGTSKSSCTLF